MPNGLAIHGGKIIIVIIVEQIKSKSSVHRFLVGKRASSLFTIRRDGSQTRAYSNQQKKNLSGDTEVPPLSQSVHSIGIKVN